LMRQDVDLILTDMNMPELDGTGIIRAVRQGFRKPTPIIVPFSFSGPPRNRDGRHSPAQ
jgi:CheY-like chemotaxis protein